MTIEPELEQHFVQTHIKKNSKDSLGFEPFNPFPSGYVTATHSLFLPWRY